MCWGAAGPFVLGGLDHLIRSGSERFIVFGEVEAAGRHVLGVEGSVSGMRAQDSRRPRRARWPIWRRPFPVQIIDPEVHRLIEEGPSRRRRFLDWGVFHVEPNFVDALATLSPGAASSETRP